MRGCSTASCSVSLRFFSPPDRSTLSARCRRRSSRPIRCGLLGAAWRSRPSASARRGPSSASRSMSSRATPGTSVGYCRTRCSPAAARSHVGMAEHVDAVERHRALEHLVAGLAHHDRRQRALAGAVRTHDGVHLAARHGEVDAADDLLARDGGPQPADLQRRRHSPARSSRRSSPCRPRSARRTRATGCVAGSVIGSPVSQAERAAVLRALDLPLVAPHLALGQRDVGVAAHVADGVHVVAAAHDGDRHAVDVDAASSPLQPSASSSTRGTALAEPHPRHPRQGAVEVELGRHPARAARRPAGRPAAGRAPRRRTRARSAARRSTSGCRGSRGRSAGRRRSGRPSRRGCS